MRANKPGTTLFAGRRELQAVHASNNTITHYYQAQAELKALGWAPYQEVGVEGAVQCRDGAKSPK